MAKDFTIGVNQGGGPPPGYLWTVKILSPAYDEAAGFLNPSQYGQLRQRVQDLARNQDPTHPIAISVDAIEDFFELREKGGTLGNMNVRVFFHLDKDDHSIVILGAIKKQNNGPTPLGDRVRMSRRRRLYLELK